MATSKNAWDQFASVPSTRDMERKLAWISNIDEALKKQPQLPDLRTHLNQLLYEKNMTIADVNKEAQLDQKYIYQIFDGRKKASRDKLIAIAYGLRLSAEETQTLLKISRNQPLYVKDKRDSIILWSLMHEKNLCETNDLLDKHGFETLGSLK